MRKIQVEERVNNKNKTGNTEIGTAWDGVVHYRRHIFQIKLSRRFNNELVDVQLLFVLYSNNRTSPSLLNDPQYKSIRIANSD